MKGSSDTVTHSRRSLSDPAGWVLYLTRAVPQRLMVFVHGFFGGPVGTWEHFVEGSSPWWHESDLLFVGYNSRSDDITATAARLRRRLRTFYPQLPDELLEEPGVRIPEGGVPYRELSWSGTRSAASSFEGRYAM